MTLTPADVQPPSPDQSTTQVQLPSDHSNYATALENPSGYQATNGYVVFCMVIHVHV